MNRDEIEIRRLEVETHIGVPEEERATPQKLWISIWMRPSQGFSALQDNVENTVDYHAVSVQITELSAARPRRLIETLAVEIAEILLLTHPLASVDVKIEKRILPNTEFVAVKIHRERS